MSQELDNKFNELKEYSTNLKIKNINKRIYDLKLNEQYFKSLKEQDLIYIHVKLHNALAFKKPFANKENIKKAHDELIKVMKYHPDIGDYLDKNGI